MKWKGQLVVVLGCNLGGLSYGSLQDKVVLGPKSDLAQALVMSLKKSLENHDATVEGKVGWPMGSVTEHTDVDSKSLTGTFANGIKGEVLNVKCIYSLIKKIGDPFKGCEIVKNGSKPNGTSLLTIKELIFAQPLEESEIENEKWFLSSTTPLAQSFNLALLYDPKQSNPSTTVKHGFFQIDTTSGYLVECIKFKINTPPGRGRGRGHPDFIPLLPEEGFSGCHIKLTAQADINAPLATIDDLVKVQLPHKVPN
jgi:hypothetical protein